MAGTMTRRALVGGGAVAVLGAGAVSSGAVPGRTWLHGELRDRYHEWFGPHAHIPSAPASANGGAPRCTAAVRKRPNPNRW